MIRHTYIKYTKTGYLMCWDGKKLSMEDKENEIEKK